MTGLGTGVMESDRSTPISNERSSQPRRKEHIITFRLNEIVHLALFNSSIYTVEVNVGKLTILVNTDSHLLSDEPVIAPRPIRKIIDVRHGDEDCTLVMVEFSRSGGFEDKIHLRFESSISALHFVILLQKLTPTLRAVNKSK